MQNAETASHFCILHSAFCISHSAFVFSVASDFLPNVDSPALPTARFSTTVEKLWILNDIRRPAPAMNVWKQVLARLEQVVDRTEYENWFAPTRFVAQKGDTMDVSVPSQRFVDEIRERYGPQIRGVLNEISPERVQLRSVVDEALSASLLPLSVPQSNELPPATFNPRYQFETFVVGNSNQLAYAEC